MTRKRMFRVLSYFTLGTGIICVTLSLIFSNTYIGGYKGSVEINQKEPYGWYQEHERDYEIVKFYWREVCVNKHEPEYLLSVNKTLGTFSRGDIIEIEDLYFLGEEEGETWNEQAYQVVNGQMISVPNQDVVIRRSFDRSNITGGANVLLVENGNKVSVWLLNETQRYLQSIFFYVNKEGIYTLEIEGIANQPFYVHIYYKIITTYGRLKEPLLYIGYVLTAVGIVSGIMSLKESKRIFTLIIEVIIIGFITIILTYTILVLMFHLTI